MAKKIGFIFNSVDLNLVNFMGKYKKKIVIPRITSFFPHNDLKSSLSFSW